MSSDPRTVLQPIRVLSYSGDRITPATWERYGQPQPVTVLLGPRGFGPTEPISVPIWQDGGPVSYVGLFDAAGQMLAWYRPPRTASKGDTWHIPAGWTISHA